MAEDAIDKLIRRAIAFGIVRRAIRDSAATGPALLEDVVARIDKAQSENTRLRDLLSAELERVKAENAFLVAEVARLREAMAWRPIETARAGETVLLYWPPEYSPSDRRRLDLPEMIRVDWVGSTPNREPTHWQPLPAPPVSETQKR